jgi:hypothetical protein
MTEKKNTAECCPPFDPEIWDDKVSDWKNKPFIQDSVRQFFHIPLNMGQVVTRMWSVIEQAGAAPDNKDFLMLAYDPSPWKSVLSMTVTREIPGARNVKLSGTFMSRVFDGPYAAAPRWFKEMEGYVQSKGKKAVKQYFYYTTCPKCAKKYGHNYVVAFAQVE